MTPAEVRAKVEAKYEQRNEEWKFLDMLNGVHCSVLANINRSKDASPYKAEDFTVMEKKKASPEEIVAAMDAMAGGKHD
jgi:hypothetical protein